MRVYTKRFVFVFDGVLPAKRGIPEGTLVPLQFLKKPTRLVEGPQKALQGSEIEAGEFLGGTTEKSIPPNSSH